MTMKIVTLRRENLRRLIKERGGAKAAAEKLGYTNASFISQMAGPNPKKNISEKQARTIEEAFALPEGWLDEAEPSLQHKNNRELLESSLVHLVRSIPDTELDRIREEKFGELCAFILHELRKGALDNSSIERIVRLVVPHER